MQFYYPNTHTRLTIRAATTTGGRRGLSLRDLFVQAGAGLVQGKGCHITLETVQKHNHVNDYIFGSSFPFDFFVRTRTHPKSRPQPPPSPHLLRSPPHDVGCQAHCWSCPQGVVVPSPCPWGGGGGGSDRKNPDQDEHTKKHTCAPPRQHAAPAPQRNRQA